MSKSRGGEGATPASDNASLNVMYNAATTVPDTVAGDAATRPARVHRDVSPRHLPRDSGGEYLPTYRLFIVL